MNRERGSRLLRSTPAVAVAALVLAATLIPTAAMAHPGQHPGSSHQSGLGLRINSPDGLADFFEGVPWSGTPQAEGETAELIYAGSGCTPASYAPVADQIGGNIALVDAGSSQTNPADVCPTYTFAQKVQAAEQAGAIGLVQIAAEGDEPDGGSALVGSIPTLEVKQTTDILDVRRAVISGTAVNATMTPPVSYESSGPKTCEGGMAGPFPCDGIDLLSFVSKEDFNAPEVSDIWGWTDPETGDEYAIVGKLNGVAFFRITDPTDPAYLGDLPNPGLLEQLWHDVKVYENHAFIVSESVRHGMEVFDLTRLRDAEEVQQDEVRNWDTDAHYPFNDSAHNIEINTETGYAYIVGGNTGIVVPDQCLSGLHMVDINDPKNPTFAGCYLVDGGPGTAARTVGPPATDVSPAAYVHDTQCVIYKGPDERYTGRELCFNAAEDQITIADVTDKLNPVTVGTVTYDNVAYAHQGNLTDDHGFLLVNDELDEQTLDAVTNTRTIVIDVRDLENPKVHFEHHHNTESIDHNNYVHEGFAYQSNYTSGLRVLDTAGVADGSLEEVAFFDTYPTHDEATFDGTWSNYPFFDSGTIALSGIGEGLFLLRVQDGVLGDGEAGVEVSCTNCPVDIRAGETGTASLRVANTGSIEDSYDISTEDVPEGWNVTPSSNSASPGPGTSDVIDLGVEVPVQARAGMYTFTARATSTEDPSVSETAEIVIEVVKGKPSDPGTPPTNGAAGSNGGGQDTSTLRTSHAASPAGAASSVPGAAAILAGLLVLGLVRRAVLRRSKG